ncbi:MAG TPA: winged helix-turn-helix domain-containing protein [Pyrinomonadaceae bacterium]
MFGQTQTAYEFGPFRVDPRERQLTRDGSVVPLRPKVFDILLVLVENSGHILTKDDVMRHVWSDAAVEEGNIARTISTLREALGEGPREQRYIETIPWRGYRFVAAVRQVAAAERWKAIESIAVLPIVNVSSDPKLEYLSEGITDSLIGRLAQFQGLRVTSRNSSFRYKARDVDARTVGRELRVQALLLGRLTQTDDLLSISVELIDTSDDRHIWGAQYIRGVDDLLAIDETIVSKLRDKLRLNNERKAYGHTENHQSYVCYLKGRYYFNKLTPDSVEKAKQYLQKAIEEDPAHALAHAALGDCYSYLAQRDQAKQCVLTALELDENLGEAHASLGWFQFLYEWSFEPAERSFKRALELNVNYAEAHHWYAIYLANVGRHLEAEREAGFAVDLDPLSLLMNMTAALNFYLAREHDKALEQLQKVLEMQGDFLAARSVRGNVLVQKGLYEEAMSEFDTVLQQLKGTPPAASVKAIMAHAYGRWGKRQDALQLLEELTHSGSASPYSIAAIHAALNNVDAAFEWLNKAYEQHDFQLVSLKVDPSLDGLRSDARFAALVRRVGIA